MKIKDWTRSVKLAAGFALRNSVALAVLAPLFLGVSTTAQAAPAPWAEDAFAKAKIAPTAEGKWVVTATVIMEPLDGEGDTLRASGPVSLAGEALNGDLPMQINDAPPANQSLSFNLQPLPDYMVSLGWMIAGKPFLGRLATTFKPRALPGKDYLALEQKWNGEGRRIRIFLTSAFEATKTAPPPIRQKKNPIGKRYKVEARLVVTNSEDGILDNTIEIDGKVTMGYYANGVKQTQNLGTIITQPLSKGASLPFANGIYVADVFAVPGSGAIIINGLIVDRDSESGGDSMWDPQATRIGLAKFADKGEYKIAGDGDSESCDVYLTITAREDLY